MIHHSRISSDSEMKGSSSSNMRQRHSVDWHLIESGRGGFDCTSCQYHVIVFLTYVHGALCLSPPSSSLVFVLQISIRGTLFVLNYLSSRFIMFKPVPRLCFIMSIFISALATIKRRKTKVLP